MSANYAATVSGGAGPDSDLVGSNNFNWRSSGSIANASGDSTSITFDSPGTNNVRVNVDQVVTNANGDIVGNLPGSAFLAVGVELPEFLAADVTTSLSAAGNGDGTANSISWTVNYSVTGPANVVCGQLALIAAQAQ